ncbi:MAG TPA: TolC family protein [Acidobacteriota bacterium]|nr:TolC family protein [Acidobacteriota bacterium]
MLHADFYISQKRELAQARFSKALFRFLVLLLVSTSIEGETFERLDLQQAIELALSNNPQLQAAEHRLEGRRQFTRFSDVRPNPSITLQTENWRFSRNPAFVPGDELDLFAFITQPLVRGDKRTRRFEVASEDQRLAELELEALRWQIQQEVKLAYWQALATQKELNLLKENLSYFNEITEYHRVRVREGVMAEADLIRVLLEEKRMELEIARAELEAQRARSRLLRSMGSPAQTPDFQLVDLPLTHPTRAGVGRSELIETAVTRRFEVRIAQARAERARSQLALENALAKPDWEVIFGYKRNSGFDTLLAGLHIPLPLFDKNLSEISMSRSEVDRTEATLEGTIRRVVSEVNESIGSLQKHYSVLIEMERGILDRAKESWQISRAAYEEGATDLLRLLDSQRALNEVNRLYTESQMRYQISLIELETSVGEADLNIGMEVLSEP